MGIDPNYLAKFNKKSSPSSERSYYIGLITDRTNESRKQAGYKPWRYAFVNYKLSHLSTLTIKDHYWQADKAENFSRYFWGLLKVKAPLPSRNHTRYGLYRF